MRNRAKQGYTYGLGQMIWPVNELGKFQELFEQYGNQSDRFLINEIMKLRDQVPAQDIQRHIQNLELLGQLNGFTTAEQKQKIEYVKRILSGTGSEASTQSDPQGQFFFFGTSLLLWFLLLVLIWRSPIAPIY